MLKVDIEVAFKPFLIQADFSISSTEILGFYGPSGSGKTSVMLALSGFLKVKKEMCILIIHLGFFKANLWFHPKIEKLD